MSTEAERMIEAMRAAPSDMIPPGVRVRVIDADGRVAPKECVGHTGVTRVSSVSWAIETLLVQFDSPITTEKHGVKVEALFYAEEGRELERI